MTQRMFQCYECIHDECDVRFNQLSICKSELNCWRSSLRDSVGNILHSRGCVFTPEHNQQICSNLTQVVHNDYRYTCCDKEFCNSDEFPTLSDHLSDGHWIYFIMYILIAVLIALFISFVIASIMLLYRGRHVLRQPRPRQPNEIPLEMMRFQHMNGNARIIP